MTTPATETMKYTVTTGFDIQPSRFLLFLFVPYIIMQSVTGRKLRLLQGSSYEKFLIAFYFTVLISLIHHLGKAIDIREAVVTYAGWLTFPVMYIILREKADKGMIIGILRGFIAIGILSSIVAVIQFFVYPDFLRYTFDRPAFGGYLRSNGLFRDEYIHSYFCIIASYATILFVKNRLPKGLIFMTLAIGIALSFHRMSYVVFLLTLGLSSSFLLKEMKPEIKVALIVSMVLAIVSVSVVMESHRKSELVEKRLKADTVTERLDFFKAAAKRISKEWVFGVGGADTKAYYYDAMVSGHEYVARGEGGGIHNLYLFLAYFYGIPVSLCFLFFLLAAARFFWKCFRHRHIFYLLPTLTILMSILANLTNYFPPNTRTSLYVAIIIGISISTWKNGLEDMISL